MFILIFEKRKEHQHLSIAGKPQQRLYFLRRLRRWNATFAKDSSHGDEYE